MTARPEAEAVLAARIAYGVLLAAIAEYGDNAEAVNKAEEVVERTPYIAGEDMTDYADEPDDVRDYAEERYWRAFCIPCGSSPCGWDGVPDGLHTDDEVA
jgi:hypothetical protein